MSKMLSGEELEEKCRKLGIDTLGDYQSTESIHKRIRLRAMDHELQVRLTAYQRSIRESRMWIMALLSALASVASAIVAVVAVLYKMV